MAVYSGSDKRLAFLFEQSGIKEITQAEYDDLPDTKYTDGILYCIKDADSAVASFIYGTSAPADTLGMVGNIYVQTDAQETTVENVYFKTDSGWIPMIANGNVMGW